MPTSKPQASSFRSIIRSGSKQTLECDQDRACVGMSAGSLFVAAPEQKEECPRCFGAGQDGLVARARTANFRDEQRAALMQADAAEFDSGQLSPDLSVMGLAEILQAELTLRNPNYS